MKVRIFIIFILSVCLLDAKPTSLERLSEGNQRFVRDKSIHPNRAIERREETSIRQEPFAAILGCSDSRVSPEIIFDQGIGDLFIVRVAGNVAGPLELASLEYSVLYLHSNLIVVLGHENCGAVNAVMQGQTKDIEPIASLIQPAVDSSMKTSGNHLENAIKENVLLVKEQLMQNPVLKNLIDQKLLEIKGGYYNFHSGRVEFF